MSTMVVQEHHLWLNLAEMKDVDKARFLDAPATPSRALPSSSRQYSSRPRQSSTSCSGVMYHPPLPPGPGLSLPIAVGALLRPPELNRHLGRRFKPLAGERRLPASQPGGEENPLFCSAAGPRASGTHFSRKRNFLFLRVLRSMGRQCAMPCFLTLAHNPLLPAAKRVRFGDDVPPHAPLASPVWDPGSSLRMPQNAPPSVPSTPTPFRCTTTGTSIVPLEPLAQCLEAWLTLPSLSRWLTRTIRLGYAIQLARRPPKFNGVLETLVAVRNAPVLREEIAVLLAKDAIEPVAPAEMRQGFHSTYFVVPKKSGQRPILDQRVSNRACTSSRSRC